MNGLTSKCSMSFEEIICSFKEIAGKWKGCDWPTHFGPLDLNLNGLKSAQATLMARATTGTEGAEWRRAADWLARVERDAKKAEQDAKNAIDLASHSHVRLALERIQDACDLEGKYHQTLVWQPLRDAIAAIPDEPNMVKKNY